MNRSISLIAGGVLVTTLFVGCGSDSKSGSGGSFKGYCAKVVAYKAKSDELGAVFSGTPDAAQMKDAFTTLQKMAHDLGNNAPADIKKDVATEATALDSMVKILAKYDYDFTKLAAAPEFADFSSSLDSGEVKAATDRLEKYSTDTCGIASVTSTT